MVSNMVQFKLEKNKCIVLVYGSNLYVAENNADVIKFYIPKIYDDINMEENIYTLRMILPNGTYYPLMLNKEDSYMDYIIYSALIDGTMTQNAGDISMELSVINADKNIIFKTNVFYITVYESIGTGDMSEDQKDQLDWLTMEVDKLNKNKADNIYLDANTNELQLSSNGELIGDKVILPESSESSEIIIFGNDE